MPIEVATLRQVFEQAPWLSEAIDRALVGRALDALEGLLTPQMLGRMAKAAADGRHPMEWDTRFVPNALSLLELGLAIEALPALGKKQRELLCDPARYHPAQSELWAGFLLRRSGAKVEYEPPGAGRRPDWRATWSDGRSLVFETKYLRSGSAIEVRTKIQLTLCDALLRAVSADPILRALRLSIDLDSRWVARQLPENPRSVPEESVVRGLAVPIVSAMRACISGATGVYALGELGRCTVSDGEAALDFGFSIDDDQKTQEVRRLRDVVEDAHGQAKRMGVPAIAFIEGVHDYFTLWALEAIQDELMAGEWAPELAAVAVRVFEKVEGASMPYSWLAMIPGPKVGAIPPDFWRAFRVCGRGHLHFEPLMPANEEHLCGQAPGLLTRWELLDGEQRLREGPVAMALGTRSAE